MLPNLPRIRVACLLLLGCHGWLAQPCLAADANPTPSPRSNLAFNFPPLLAADSSVERGRAALDEWVDPPWYDDQTDDLRPMTFDTSTTGGFRFAPGGGSWPDWLAYFIWTLLGIAFVVLLIVLIRVFMQSQPAPVPAYTPKQLLEIRQALPTDVDPSRVDFLAEARRLYAAGRYSDAIVFLYSYFLLRLDRHQKIHLAVGKTNRQYLRELGRSPLARVLETVMGPFEDVFFGRHDLDSARCAACFEQLSQLDHFLVEPTP